MFACYSRNNSSKEDSAQSKKSNLNYFSNNNISNTNNNEIINVSLNETIYQEAKRLFEKDNVLLLNKERLSIILYNTHFSNYFQAKAYIL